MTPRPVPRAPLELDTFRVAVGLGVIAGALALLFPPLNSLVAALVALAAAGWMAGWSRSGRETSRPVGTGIAWACVGLGGAAFVALDPPWAAGRGLVLSLSLLPLWLLDRRRGRATARSGVR